jgi:hypothetical protein
VRIDALLRASFGIFSPEQLQYNQPLCVCMYIYVCVCMQMDIDALLRASFGIFPPEQL